MRVLLNLGLLNLVVVTMLGLVGCVANQPAAAKTGFEMEDLGNGIYVHHGKHLDIDEGYQGDICNISFVVGSKGVAVIDTGGSLKVGQQLRREEEKKTASPLPQTIKKIVPTKVALHKVINSIDVSQFDSSPYLQI